MPDQAARCRWEKRLDQLAGYATSSIWARSIIIRLHIDAAFVSFRSLADRGRRQPVLAMEMFGWDGRRSSIATSRRKRAISGGLSRTRRLAELGREDYEPLVQFARRASALLGNEPAEAPGFARS